MTYGDFVIVVVVSVLLLALFWLLSPANCVCSKALDALTVENERTQRKIEVLTARICKYMPKRGRPFKKKDEK